MKRSTPARTASFALSSLAILLLLAGCAREVVGRLPENSQYVGGGLTINYTADKPGTVYLYEWTTKKIIATQSLKEGEFFEFDVTSQDPQTLKKLLGVDTDKLRPVLYFRPNE